MSCNRQISVQYVAIIQDCVLLMYEIRLSKILPCGKIPLCTRLEDKSYTAYSKWHYQGG